MSLLVLTVLVVGATRQHLTGRTPPDVGGVMYCSLSVWLFECGLDRAIVDQYSGGVATQNMMSSPGGTGAWPWARCIVDRLELFEVR